MGSTDFEKTSRASKWHQSGLSQIHGCARQWWLENVAGFKVPEKVSTITGTAYHLAVEAHQRPRLDGGTSLDEDTCTQIAVEETERLLELADPVAVDTFTKKLGQEAVIEHTRVAVRNFFHASVQYGPPLAQVLDGWEPVALEEYVSAPLVDGARDLGGTVDGVYRTPTGALTIIDHKTTGAAINSVWGKPGAGAAQATHYASLAVMAGWSHEMPAMNFLIVKRTPGGEGARVVPYRPTDHDVVELGRSVREAERVVAAGVFAPNPNWQWCNATSCFFWRECQQTGELAGPVDSIAV